MLAAFPPLASFQKWSTGGPFESQDRWSSEEGMGSLKTLDSPLYSAPSDCVTLGKVLNLSVPSGLHSASPGAITDMQVAVEEKPCFGLLWVERGAW